MTISDSFYVRLSEFYREQYENHSDVMGSIWSAIFKYEHKSLHESLLKNSVADISSVLHGGVGLGTGYTDTELTDDTAEKFNKFLRISSVCLGLRPLQNRQQNFDVDRMDNDSIICDIEAYLKCNRHSPVEWLSRPGTMCANKFVYCSYLAGAVYMYSGNLSSVIEIGPGTGMIGAILHGLGCKTYSVVDLPIGCVLIAWIMAKTFGEESVWLCGEMDNPSSFARIMSPNQICDIGSDYDCVINSDSFPEIPSHIQQAYLDMAHRAIKDRGFIYSVNQESTTNGQISINRAVAEHGAFRCSIRKIFPIRDGYVEEIFVKK